MKSRRVVITGLGPISGLGLGIEPTWRAVLEKKCAIAPMTLFDPSGLPCHVAGEIRDFKVTQFVPKSYRKAVKVMARDIELAVAAADLAARDAKLSTRGTLPDGDTKTSYEPSRVGAHIGAGLIAAEVNELTEALDKSRVEPTQNPDSEELEAVASRGGFDFHKWGREGMNKLSPLWLLKYLPNMLACHVTIIHDTQGPSNTITCAEASSALSIGESLRVIERGDADASFCGGTESKLNPMALLRQILIGWVNTTANRHPSTGLRPFSHDAAGTLCAEGGGIIILEALDTFLARTGSVPGSRIYAEVTGFGASQSIHPESRNRRPDPAGKGIALAIKSALRESNIAPDQIDLICPFGMGWLESDQAEAAALRTVFGSRLPQIPIASFKAFAGNTGAGSGGLDVCLLAKAISEQVIPPSVNRPQPLQDIAPADPEPRNAPIRYALALSSSLGGQNAALVLKRYEA